MNELIVKNYLNDNAGQLVNYESAYRAMKQFTHERSSQTMDELWVLEHEPVYTLGQAGDSAHILNANNIPIIKTDRGGQVTYHGPGQIMFYFLADIERLSLGVRNLVESLENIVIAYLDSKAIEAFTDRAAPGIYVKDKQGARAKITAIGLRISKNKSYHGFCFNYDFDQTPFAGINPCGYEGQQVSQLSDWLPKLPSKNNLVNDITALFAHTFSYKIINKNAKWS